jgi:predicted transcriptional regulator of viral defense system
MDLLTLQRNIEDFGLEIFTLNDVIKISGQKKEVIKTTLSRLTKQSKIFRLKTKYYTFRQIENKFQLQKLFPDTYISLYSALEYYGSTTQRFNNLDLITKNLLKNQNIENTEIHFHKVKRGLFFGYKKVQINNTEVFISNIEKTIIDCTYFSSIIYLTEIDDFIKKNKEKINLELISIYLNKIASSVLSKRVGYLLELNNLHLEEIRINNKYESLNKNLSKTGTKNTKWKLIINENLN